ncbi:DUF932 domain-containing protein [Escherichia coli]|nr:DUF932 domain-containing protein [Escherichia coli]
MPGRGQSREPPEGFQSFFACQTLIRDLSSQEHTKHVLRRAVEITRQQVPEIILLNSHDASGSDQMLPEHLFIKENWIRYN